MLQGEASGGLRSSVPAANLCGSHGCDAAEVRSAVEANSASRTLLTVGVAALGTVSAWALLYISRTWHHWPAISWAGCPWQRWVIASATAATVPALLNAAMIGCQHAGVDTHWSTPSRCLNHNKWTHAFAGGEHDGGNETESQQGDLFDVHLN